MLHNLSDGETRGMVPWGLQSLTSHDTRQTCQLESAVVDGNCVFSRESITLQQVLANVSFAYPLPCVWYYLTLPHSKFIKYLIGCLDSCGSSARHL